MIETIRFPVSGMTCVACIGHIVKAVRKLDGVEKVQVDLGDETATVRRDPALVSDEALAVAVSRAGYEADLGAAIRVAPTEARGFLARLLGRG